MKLLEMVKEPIVVVLLNS